MSLAQAALDTIRRDTGDRRPHYERYSLLAVPSTVEQLFGLDVPSGLRDELQLARSERVVVIVIDGLGHLKLEALMAKGHVRLGALERGVRIPITSVFPPTTTTALTSLSTGACALSHGILGYTMFLPEIGSLANMILLATPGAAAGSLADLGLKPEKMLGVSTLYERLAALGVPSTLFLPKHIADSGLSKVLYRGIDRTMPYFSMADLCMLIRRALERRGKQFLSVYWPMTDTLAHAYGPESEAFHTEIAQFFSALDREVLRDARDTTFLVTADHGFCAFDPATDIVSCPDHPQLREGLLLPPAGEARAATLFLRPGYDEQVRSFFARTFPDAFTVLSTEEALEMGLWGPERPSDAVRASLGDLLVLARERKVLMWPRTEFKLRGMHGGLLPEEIYVPLIAAPF